MFRLSLTSLSFMLPKAATLGILTKADGFCFHPDFPNESISCSGYCYSLSVEQAHATYNVSRKAFCVPASYPQWCEGVHPYIFIVGVILIIPTLISLSIRFCLRGLAPSIGAYITDILSVVFWSLFVNCGACLLMHDESNTTYALCFTSFLLLYIVFFAVWLDFSCFKNPRQHSRYVFCTMSRTPLTTDELYSTVSTIRHSPPNILFRPQPQTDVIWVDGKSAVFPPAPLLPENPDVADPGFPSLDYKTWEDRSIPFAVPQMPGIYIVRSNINAVYAPDASEAVAQGIHNAPLQIPELLKSSLPEREVAKLIKKPLPVVAFPRVDGQSDSFLVAIGVKTKKFWRTWVARVLWYLSGFLGMRSLFETIYCFGMKDVDFNTIKYVSMSEDCRAKKDQKDEAAATTTVGSFQSGDIRAPLTEQENSLQAADRTETL